jgi:DNA-binding IclR family transcriptional regulator
MAKSQRKQELILLRQVIEPAFFLLILLRLGRLPTKVSLARILGMDRRKVGRLIDRLIDLGFVLSIPGRQGYCLSDSLTPAQQRVLLFFSQAHESDQDWFIELSKV